jgi:hypothetical protein
LHPTAPDVPKARLPSHGGSYQPRPTGHNIEHEPLNDHFLDAASPIAAEAAVCGTIEQGAIAVAVGAITPASILHRSTPPASDIMDWANCNHLKNNGCSEYETCCGNCHAF